MGAHQVTDGDGGEGAPVGLARARVYRCRARGAFASAQNVAADHEEAVRVDGLARSDEFVPPAGFLSVFQQKALFAIVFDEVFRFHGADAGFMRIFTHMHKCSKKWDGQL